MDKKLFRSILWSIFFATGLVAIIINLDKISGAVSFLSGILLPLTVGFCIAFLLNRPFEKFKNLFGKMFKKSKKPHSKLCITLSIITVYIIFLAIIAIIFGLVLPQLTDSLKTIYDNRNVYINNIVEITNAIESFLGPDISLLEELEKVMISLIEKLPEYIANVMPKIFAFAGTLASSLTNILMGFAMSIYMLASKDMLLRQSHNFLYAFVPLKYAQKASKLAKTASEIFGKYINGQLLDALLVGIVCFIGMSIIGLPYALLISTIISVTNIIPIFGPFIGAIPSAFILLIGKPIDALWFIIFILVLQQIDGNIICPRIVGDAVGLPAWWTLVAIFIGGGMFGFIGMIIGVPTFTVIYKMLKKSIQRRLEKSSRLD